MGFIFWFSKKLIRLLIYFIVFAAIIVLTPNLPPYTNFSKIELEPILPRAGPLAPNNDLNNIEQLYKDKLLGPENFQLYKGEVYTSLATGEIVKLSPGKHVTFVAQFGKPCSDLKEEHVCGRPLGFVIDEKKNLMYVADAYYGIWSLDLNTNKKTLLVSPNVEIDGHIPKLFNSVTLDSKGNLYYTYSSADFPLYDGALSMLTDPTGRLLQYNAAKNESKVLLDKLWFSNGLVVSPNDDFIVVAETCAFRLVKFYLNGPRKGQKEVFVAGLPGMPDNARVLPDGSGLQVALYVAYGEDDPVITHSLAATPLVRKFVTRLQVLVQTGFQFLNQYFPHVILEDIIYTIGSFKSVNSLLTNTSGIVHIDWDGNIINSYFHTEGLISISDGILYNDRVYLGQPHGQNYVASVPAPATFKKAFTTKDKPEAKREVPPTQTTSKPTEKPKTAEPVKTTTPSPVKVEPVVKKAEAPKATQPPPKTTPPPPKPTPQPAKPAQQPPKPAQQPTKPAQQPPKPAQQPPKPTQQPPTPAQQPPKAAQQPTTTQKPPTTQKPAEKKVNAAPPPPAKQAPETKQKEQKQAKGDTTAKPAEQKKQKTEAPKEKPVPPTPIIEEIPSDTIKPNKETLKVIKKGGPAEIPNPEL